MKYTISEGKAYKHRGFHKHRSAKKHWFHYFYDEEFNFHSEPVSYLKAMYLKSKKVYAKAYYCDRCYTTFRAIVKDKDQEIIECPYCEA